MQFEVSLAHVISVYACLGQVFEVIS